MKEILSQLHFLRPLFFLLFGLVPLLWMRWRGRSWVVILWRTVILSFLVLSLADPQLAREVKRKIEKRKERVLAFDLSRSIPQQTRRWMRQVAEQDLTPSAKDRIFVFGGKPREVREWERWLRRDVSDESIEPGQTNLESLFSALLRLPGRSRDVYLFTDGWQNRGRVEDTLPSLSLAAVRVFPLLPSVEPEFADVTVKRLLAPHRGKSGEGIKLRVLLENHGARKVRGKIVLRRDGRLLREQKVELEPGSQILTYRVTLPDRGLTSFQANFVPSGIGTDLFSKDNRATAWVAVQSREKVLVLNGRSEQGKYLEEILKRRGFRVTSSDLGEPPPAPGDFGAVVFNNVARERIRPDYLAAVERYVAGGGSFIMLGGEGSFGAGGYRGTPVEDLLPVRLKEPKKEEKRRAIVLVIDKSGSMRRKKKLLYAKEAAEALVKNLRERDLVGVVGFDISPFVVVPLGPLEAVRDLFRQRVDRLKAGGKTYLYPALVEAKRQLEREEATWKHVIILSDGETGGSGSDYIDLVSVMKAELKITVSAVAIGGQANIPLLRRIAKYGGGLFHHTYDPTSLPGIVLGEIKEKPKEEPFVERELVPALGRGSRLLAGFSERPFPAVQGYVETEIKPKAGLDLTVPSGGKRDPLLASWTYGKGRAVAFTTDLHGRWTKQWIQWKGLEEFWRHVFDWMIPPKGPLPPHEVRLNLSQGRPVLDLYLYQERAHASLFRFSLTGKGSRGKGVLRKVAPGHYRAALPIAAPGDYRVELTEETAGKKIRYPPVGYTLPFDPRAEIPRGNFNLPLLEQIARSTGGEINPKRKPDAKAEEVIRTSQPLRSFFIFLALILFLLEIIFRRFVFRLG